VDSLTGAAIAAGAAWLSVLAAVFLPVPDAWFQRLRLVGAASLAVVGLTLVGLPIPPAAPAVVLAVGCAVALAWPTPAKPPPVAA
jgi:hypothetical protein